MAVHPSSFCFMLTAINLYIRCLRLAQPDLLGRTTSLCGKLAVRPLGTRMRCEHAHYPRHRFSSPSRRGLSASCSAGATNDSLHREVQTRLARSLSELPN